MPRRPTLGTVAEEAGVSIPTVSQVMRGTGRISEVTRQKVLKAAKKLHYMPDLRAASIRSGENNEIGFVINQLQNPFNAEVVSGLVDRLEDEGYLVSILDTRDDAARQSVHLQTFIRNGRGGLLWVPAFDTPRETFDLLRAHGIPTVTFLRRAGDDFDHVGIRNTEATARGTGYLADLGHRRIAYLGGREMSTVRAERIEGYRRTLAARDLCAPVIWPCADTKRAGMEALSALRAAHPEITAVVCNGDMVALGACLSLQRAGLVPGRDVSVIGFDDIDDAALATPALTTLAVSPRNLGRRLAQVRLERLRDPALPKSYTDVTAELIVRDTTGAPPGRDTTGAPRGRDTTGAPRGRGL